MAAAHKILDGVRGTFATAGLRVNPDKCHYLFKEGRHVRYQLSPVDAKLELEGKTIERREQLLFLGNCIRANKDSRVHSITDKP